MGSELDFGGKKYISVSRVSKISGYNSDYIGQLCRKKTLDARMVGGTWFVNEESLKAHKAAALAAPRGRVGGKLPVYMKVVDGKKFISAARASKIFGYSSDYIGQLCRNKTLDCMMVGRSWFVGEESLKKHKAAASLATRGRIEIYEKSPDQKTADLKTADSKIVPAKKVSIVTPVPSIAAVRPEKKEFISRSPNGQWQNSVGKKNKIFVRVGISAIVLLAVISLTAFAPLSQKNNFNKPVATASVVSGFHQGLAFIGDWLSGVSLKIKTLVLNHGQSVAISDSPKDRVGVAVVPSAKDAAANEQVRQYVTQSFSDETKIEPNPTGDSGLIKPVFKAKNDQEYLYVIVPVKENKN